MKGARRVLRRRIDIKKALLEHGYPPKRLREEKLFGEATIQNMRYQKPVSWAGLETLCRLLDVQPGDLIEHIEQDGE